MITQYHRPSTMANALELLAGPGGFVLAGGTTAVAVVDDATAVDIQSLGLDGISLDGPTVTIGAATRLADVMASPDVPDALRELARREAPSTIRNAATIGGTIGANDPESELLAGLLAYRARISVAHAGSSSDHGIAEVLENPELLSGGIITGVGFDTAGYTTTHRTARTPMDRPIVAVVGHRDAQGDVTIAITGVSDHVVATSHTDIDELDPPSDFRGSSQYRMHLARALTERVMDDINTGGAS